MVLEVIATGIAKGDVALAGFGKFTTSRRAARPGRNPRSGEKIIIGPSSRVTFRAAKGLKDRVSGT
jgi:DNA-binding protein HU-beta